MRRSNRMKKTGCDVAMDAHGFGGRPGSRSSNKHPQQIHLLARTESTSYCIHFIILLILLSVRQTSLNLGSSMVRKLRSLLQISWIEVCQEVESPRVEEP